MEHAPLFIERSALTLLVAEQLQGQHGFTIFDPNPLRTGDVAHWAARYDQQFRHVAECSFFARLLPVATAAVTLGDVYTWIALEIARATQPDGTLADALHSLGLQTYREWLDRVASLHPNLNTRFRN